MLTIKPVDFQRQTSPHGVGANTIGLVWKETTKKRRWFMELWVPHAYYRGETVCTHISLEHANPSHLIRYLDGENIGIGQRLTSRQFSFGNDFTLYIDTHAYGNFQTALQRYGCQNGKEYNTDPNTHNTYHLAAHSLALSRMLNRTKQR